MRDIGRGDIELLQIMTELGIVEHSFEFTDLLLSALRQKAVFLAEGPELLEFRLERIL